MTGASGIDWNHEAIHSLFWILAAFAITTGLLLACAAVLIRFSGLGREFWRISRGFFISRHSALGWVMLAVVVLMAVFTVRMTVLFSYYYNDLYTALQHAFQAITSRDSHALGAAQHAFWNAILLFGILATIWVIQQMFNFWISEAFQIRWRVWLNERVVGDWLDGRAFYRNRFIDKTIDNPDQRIQQDVDDFVRVTFALTFGGTAAGYRIPANGIVGAGLTIVSFAPILWHLSGPLTLFGLRIPHALIFGTGAYILVATLVSFWVGRPLIRLNFWNQRLTADFRYALVHLRDNAENVAFYRGEPIERRGIFARFSAIIKNYWSIVYRSMKFSGWNLVVSQTSQVFIALIQAPRVLAGAITLGDFQQSVNAFDQIHDSLSYFRDSYDAFTYYQSTLLRLDGMVDADKKARSLPTVNTETLPDALELEHLDVMTPDGSALISDLSLRMERGDSLAVKGASGSGKTTLLRSIAGMWPYARGTVRRPIDGDILFLSQVPYLPLGDLRTAIAYPADPEGVTDDDLHGALEKVQLGHLVGRLYNEADWSKILSPGEQQRLAFARILLAEPKIAFLDEATTAMDEGLEYHLYTLIRQEIPDIMLVSVAHRSTVDQHHAARLEVNGGGRWNLVTTMAPLEPQSLTFGL
jgi:putative ATP-binding cassette transporter